MVLITAAWTYQKGHIEHASSQAQVNKTKQRRPPSLIQQRWDYIGRLISRFYNLFNNDARRDGQQHNLPAGEKKISVIFYIEVRFKSIHGFFELRERKMGRTKTIM